ncbi:MAG: leucine-rich repeat domain-containing protein [Proteobacteria bacterium]|nr:leucine-rich repeat domain-containing protein [Pseudomonadota bacterium]
MMPVELIEYFMSYLNPVSQHTYLRTVSKSFYMAWENVARNFTLGSIPAISHLNLEEDCEVLLNTQQQEIEYLTENKKAILESNENYPAIINAFDQLAVINTTSRMLAYYAKEKCLNALNEAIIRKRIELEVVGSVGLDYWKIGMISWLRRAKALWLNGNFLTRFPDSLFQDETLGEFWENLTILHIRNNRLTSFPEGIRKCKALEQIHVEDNKLTSFPESIGQCVALEWLNVSHNQLTTLPNTISQCVKLKTLFAYENRLTTLPNNMSATLKYLAVHSNWLISLPEDIVNCIALKKLWLTDNYLCSIPDNLREDILVVGMDGNPITKSKLLETQKKLPSKESTAITDTPPAKRRKLN